MAIKAKYRYEPDYLIAPGETLIEALESLGMTQAELATRTGRPLKTVNEITKGKTAITPETALQFEKVLGIPASFWNSLETKYQQALARKRDRQTLGSFVSWLDELPIKDLIAREWIRPTSDKTELVLQALAFFGVTDPNVWRQLWLSPKASFHRSQAFKASPGATAAWLRIGELEAQKIRCESFDKSKFKHELVALRGLTNARLARIRKELVERCRTAGVAVVFVAELHGTHVSGATQWLSPDKALIQLSCRYKSDDQFWHAFFHEAGHILLHGKREVFIDDSGNNATEEQEREAHEFASSLLIPPNKLRHLLDQWAGDQASIQEFADELGIAPGIVVGQLQHRKILGFNQMNTLRRFKFDLTKRY
jgi:HTH-type transcriptional regulator / antitoxin HigA